MTTVAFAIAIGLLAIFFAFAFYEWFIGGRFGATKAVNGVPRRQFLFSHLGAWIQHGCNAFAANWPILVFSSAVACVVSIISLGVLAGPMTVGLARMCLAGVRDKQAKLSVHMLWNGFNVALQSFAFVTAQLLLAFSGVYILRNFGRIGTLGSGLYIAMLQTILAFGVFFIAADRVNAIKAALRSARLVSAAPFVFLLLCVVAGALGNLGAIFFGIGAIATLPLHLCVLACAFNECVNDTSSVAV
jgi:hypothetical protein